MTSSPSGRTLSLEEALQESVAHHREGRLDEAEALYRAILDVRATHADANHNLGVLLALQRREVAAGLPYLGRALEANPAFKQYWASYISALVEDGQIDAARQVLLDALNRGLRGEDFESLALRLGLPSNAPHEKLQVPNPPKVHDDSETVGASEKNNADLLEMLAQGRFADAAAQAQRLIEREPRDGVAWQVLGAALMQLGRHAEALPAMRQAVALAPNEAQSHVNLGIVLNALGLPESGEASFRDAIRLKPDHVDAHYNLGIVLKALGRRTEAEASFREAIGFRPDYAEAHNNLGIICQEQGRWAEAEASFRKAVELNPEHAEAHNNLAIVLKEQGRLAEAEASFRNVIRIRPDHSDTHYNLGILLRSQRRLAESEACFRRAIELRPAYAEAYNGLGLACQDQGQLSAAEANYRQAVQLSPDYVAAHYNLGRTLRAMGRMVEADGSLRRAIQLKPDHVDAVNDLGIVLQEQGKLNEAEATFRRAIQIDGGYAAAYSNLGCLLMIQNRCEEAEVCLRRAIELNPALADAYSNLGSALMDQGRIAEAQEFLERAVDLSPGEVFPLVNALSYRSCERGDPRRAQLEAMYARRAELAAEDRISVDFAMGKALEELHEYDRAFQAYDEGNRLHFARHPHDESVQSRFLEQIKTIYTPELFRKYAKQAETQKLDPDHRVPVFIVGMLRSGTTLIEQVLASHPAVFGAGELTVVDDLAGSVEIIETLLRDSEDAIHNLMSLRNLGKEYLRRVWERAPGAVCITDKQPGNYCRLGLIHLMLPQARIIHAMRDPMDACFSCYATLFRVGQGYTYDLAALGRYYRFYRKVMEHWQKVLPAGRILEVRYEEHVSNPEREARRMLEHVGLLWDSGCLRFHETRRVDQTASAMQVRKPMYTHSVARWKHFEKHLDVLRNLVASAE